MISKNTEKMQPVRKSIGVNKCCDMHNPSKDCVITENEVFSEISLMKRKHFGAGLLPTHRTSHLAQHQSNCGVAYELPTSPRRTVDQYVGHSVEDNCVPAQDYSDLGIEVKILGPWDESCHVSECWIDSEEEQFVEVSALPHLRRSPVLLNVAKFYQDIAQETALLPMGEERLPNRKYNRDVDRCFPNKDTVTLATVSSNCKLAFLVDKTMFHDDLVGLQEEGSDKNCIVMIDFADSRTLARVICWITEGVIEVHLGNVKDIVGLAVYLQLDDLVELCLEWLRELAIILASHLDEITAKNIDIILGTMLQNTSFLCGPYASLFEYICNYLKQTSLECSIFRIFNRGDGCYKNVEATNAHSAVPCPLQTFCQCLRCGPFLNELERKIKFPVCWKNDSSAVG